MACVMRGGRNHSRTAAPLNPLSEQNGYITTLYPEGSYNNIRHDLDRRRKVVRPEINYRVVVINVLVPLIVCFAICFWSVAYALVLLALYILLRLRGILIFFLLIYQRYASEDMRAACIFEPSCSEYMKLAIKKYGAVRGVIKGFIRLSRCRYPNGGEDFP